MMNLQDYLNLRNGNDVRGVAMEGVENQPVTLTKEAVENIAKAFCVWLISRTGKTQVRVSVGYDSRLSAPPLCSAALQGITSTGHTAIVTGLSTTPSMYMLLKDEKRFEKVPCDGSIMLTASHLPANRNGMKFFSKDGALEAEDVTELLTLAATYTFATGKPGPIEFHPYLDDYAAALVEKVRTATGEETPLSGKKVIVDAGNGVGGFFAEKVLAPLGADTEGSQFLTPDGNFINHAPNPEDKEAMRSICDAVKAAGADFGIIFDTDVDRAGAVDKNGEEIGRNRLIALISAILLSEEKGTIVTDSVTSDGLTKFIKENGGKHHRFKRGYKNVINEAIRLNNEGEYTPLAIETSGHAAFKENYFLDDGAYLIVRLLIALSNAAKEGKNLTDLIQTLETPKSAKEIRVPFSPDCDFKTCGKEILEKFAAYIEASPCATAAENNYEGFRANFDEDNGNGWALLRMSLHDPILPINVESETEGGACVIADKVYEFLKDFDCLDLSVFPCKCEKEAAETVEAVETEVPAEEIVEEVVEEIVEETAEQLEIPQTETVEDVQPIEEVVEETVEEVVEEAAATEEVVEENAVEEATQLEIPAQVAPVEEPAATQIEEKAENEKDLGDNTMDVQQTTINAVRVLSAEAIEKAKSGHPGLPLGCAPIAYTLFQHFLKFNPRNAKWTDRDRYVLSAGHGSAMNYTLYYLYGYGLQKEDLMNFRQLGSKTPGHPEYGHTVGVETTTGPLGQGIANAVGMAMAEANLAAKFNKPGFPIVDHYTYAICGGGCLEEGISYEACSFAGTHGLGKLILLYDDNDITIEGDTDVTFKENIGARFAAQNWQVLHVDLATKPDDVEALSAAIEKAKAKTDKPSIIICHTRIGYGSPLEGSEKSHGAPLGADNLQKTKEKLGWPCAEAFDCPQEVFDHCAMAANAGAEKEMQWKKLFAEYEYTYPELAAAYQELMEGKKPDFDSIEDLYDFDKPMATRQTSAKILNKLAAKMPQLIGGSADLGPSNMSELKDTDDIKYGTFSPADFGGRNVHFGIREHAMAAIANGLQLHGGMQAYCATFFVFSDYCKPAMRLAALMNLPVTYIMTHDSIGVGEDGPTHQPVEQLIMLRSIPGLKVYRPADGKETAAAWVSAMTGNQPTALILTRQNLPQYANSGKAALKGGYVLEDCEGTPDVILMGTGSEIEICVKAKAVLEVQGVKARVVSMPCIEEFEKQSAEYKESVLPKAIKARVCVEAGSPYSWYKYAGDCGELVCMDTFGASAPASVLFSHFGFTAENVAEKAMNAIRNANPATQETAE